MASIDVNGSTVHLHPTTLRDFQRLAELLFQRIKPDVPVRQAAASVLFDAMRQGQQTGDTVVQTVLLALHDLGVESVQLDFEAKQVTIDKAVDTDTSRGDVRAMAVANIESGRALMAALANVQQRTIGVNGQRLRAFPQPKEPLQRMYAQITANRLVNEDVTFTSARAVGALMKAGKTVEDEEFRCALEIAASFGISEMVVDFERQRIAIRDFSESAAAAAALLQGGDAKQIAAVRERITKARAQLEDLKKQLADGTAQPGIPPRPGQPRVVLPSVIGGRRGNRRKS
jgi:hypothetical protein